MRETATTLKMNHI